jgi:hypothetical protein
VRGGSCDDGDEFFVAVSIVRTKNGEFEGECEPGEASDKTKNGYSYSG